MVKTVKLLTAMFFCIFLTSCVGEEPNDIAYITALGIDKAEMGFKYTIQFANPIKISGGAAEQGGSGGNIVENITVEGPTIYSGLSNADAIVSKDLSLAHAKIIVVSEEVAKEGLSGFIEVISRNNDIRPDVYLAIAEDSGEYLEAVKPVIELNPVKYYQLTYENKKGGPVPQNNAIEFFMATVSGDKDCVLPLAGVAGIEEENQGSEAGFGGENSEQSTEQTKENRKSEDAQINERNFQKGTKNYYAGEAGLKIKNKSETLGLAMFSGDVYIDKLGGADALIYNILTGNTRDIDVVIQLDKTPLPVTFRINQKNKPKFNIDKEKKTAEIDVKIEAELLSAPEIQDQSKTIKEREKECEYYICEACNEFLQRVYGEKGIDILGVKGKLKRQFLTNDKFNRYMEDFNAKEWKLNVTTDFTVKCAGMTY